MNKIVLAYFLPLSKDSNWSLELLREFAYKYATRALFMTALFMIGSTIAKTIGETWLYLGSLTMGGIFALLFGIFASAALDPRLR